MKEKSLKLLKILLIVAILLLSYLLIKHYSLAEIRHIIDGYGRLGAIVYIALFAILPIFLFPVIVLVLPAGIVFGIFYGTIYTLIGAVINSIIMFYLGRFLGKKTIDSFISNKLSSSMQKKLLSSNQITLCTIFFILRLLPLVSYNLINYLAGLTKIKLVPYLATTVISIIPGTIVFLNTGDKSLDISSPSFIISVILLVALVVLSTILLKVYLRRQE